MMRRRRSLCLCPVVIWRKFLCGVFLLFAWGLGHADNYTHTGMTYRHFQGIPNIMEVDCSGDGLVDSSADLLTVTLYDPRDYKVIASANLKSKECTTSASFSLCIIDEKGHRTKVRTLVLDLGQKESRLFGCNVTVTKGGVTQIRPWSIYVKADKISVSTIAMLTSTSADFPSVNKNDASTSPTIGQSRDSISELFGIHPGILITGLLFLIFFIVLSIILIVMHIKERRRRHYLAEEYDTPLPIKSEYAIPGGVPRVAGEKERILAGSSRSPRPSTSSPLPHHGRKGSGTGSGGGGSIRYQQTGALGAGFHEVPGYAAGHSISVYYAEPWSGVESESKERLRPGSRGTPTHYGHPPGHYGYPPGHYAHPHSHSGQTPHDSKAGSVSSSAPPADDA